MNLAGPLFVLFLLTISFHGLSADNNVTGLQESRQKFFSRAIFNVIQFPNTACAATNSRNGTCYTSSECAKKGGTSAGVCANGYGVCCVVTLVCGQTTSENCSYLVLGATNSPLTQTCDYKICKCNSNICRIRFDFNIFDINGPFVGTAVPGNSPATVNQGGSIGDCIIDQFVVTTPGNKGSPPICGFNNGQHIYIDASNTCAEATFSFGPGSTFSRQYDIKISQYACGDDNVAGPPDCFQYFTSNMGTISSFNFKTSGGAVTSTATHLSSQCYDLCFRRNMRMCALCFSPSIIPPAMGVNNQNSFGLSITDNPTTAAAKSNIDTNCNSDFLIIPNGNTLTNALTGFVDGTDRFCGRIFSIAGASAAPVTVCTGRKPFRITFKTDADEMTFPSSGTNIDETSMFPAGIIGFSLDYWQQPCTT